jgi:hypothetical protein
MKTQILNLEPDDDILSARDKLNWVQTQRLILVWPPHGGVLASRLDLAIFQRHAASKGTSLALVTRDREVAYHAHKLGIPVFASLRQAQSAEWRTSRQQRRRRLSLRRPPRSTPGEPIQSALERLPPRPSRTPPQLAPLTRLVVFTLGVLATLSIAAVLYPSASLRLAPTRQTQEITLEAQASPQTQSASLAGRLPAHWQGVVVEGRLALPTSGEVLTPDKYAAGQALFTNLTDGEVAIPEQAVVLAPLEDQTIRFAVAQAGRLPAGAGQTVSLPIRALAPGSAGNVPAGAIQAVLGALGTQAAVSNPEPTLGGQERRDRAPSQADRQRLLEKLRLELTQTALAELQAGLNADDLLITPSLTDPHPLEVVYDPEATEPSDELTLNLRLEYQAQVVPGEALRLLAQGVLDANLPPGFKALPQSLEIQHLQPPELQPGSGYHWRLLARRRLQALLGEEGAVQMVLGLSPEQAQQRLAADLPLQAQPEIRLAPDWWPRLPIIPFRIEVNVE